ncbi:MAG: YdaU family protein [Candidatus Thiodiazotropha endolucinida]|nr:YdaU family protein [Candidatus Thiodiazotropha taylori]MCW4276969.1 YdaU family protein [Candidatus Thiodiazotropha taylori]
MAETNIWLKYSVGFMSSLCAPLSLEEEGAFHHLLRHYWFTQKALPDEDKALANLIGVSKTIWVRKLRPALAPIFEISEGYWRLEWLEKEIKKAQEISEKRRESGRRGGRISSKNSKLIKTNQEAIASDLLKQQPTQIQTQSHNTTRRERDHWDEPLDPQFEDILKDGKA